MDTWVTHLQQRLSDVHAEELDLDPLENRVFPAAQPAEISVALSAVPAEARGFFTDLYADCGGLELPDFRNGYFVASPSRLRTQLLNRSSLNPRMLKSDNEAEIVCFGSDGGGGLFAYRTGGYAGVWFLPVGEVTNGVFNDIEVAICRVANTAREFGERLVGDVEAFLERRDDWRYLGQ